MRNPRAREGRGLNLGEAYRSLLGDDDPAAVRIRRDGLTDLRPFGSSSDVQRVAGPVVVAGPDDLIELRRIVETVTGIGTWPKPTEESGERLTVRVALSRPSDALRLVAALEGLVEDRSRAWRKWRTVIDTIAAPIAELNEVTFDALIADKTH